MCSLKNCLSIQMCRASLHTMPICGKGSSRPHQRMPHRMDGALLRTAQGSLTGALSGHRRSCFKVVAWTQQTTSCYWFPDTWAASDKQLTSKRKITHACQRDLHWGIYWNPLTRLYILCVLLFFKKQCNALPGCLWLWTIVQLFILRAVTQSSSLWRQLTSCGICKHL